MRSLSGATGLLAGAISYTLGVCALVEPEEIALPTPCAEWDLGMLLGHLSDSIADLETALRTGGLDLDRPPDPPDPGAGDPVEAIRERAADTSQPCTAISTAPVQVTRPAGIGRPPTVTKLSGPS